MSDKIELTNFGYTAKIREQEYAAIREELSYLGQLIPKLTKLSDETLEAEKRAPLSLYEILTQAFRRRQELYKWLRWLE